MNSNVSSTSSSCLPTTSSYAQFFNKFADLILWTDYEKIRIKKDEKFCQIQRQHQYDIKFDTSSLSDCVKQQLNSRTCSDFDLHNLSYTISPSVDYVDHHPLSPYYPSSNNSLLKSFNTPAYSYVSEDFLHNLSLNNNKINFKPSHSSLTYSPVIDRSNDKNYLSKLKRKQLFVNKSEMQCNSSKMITPKSSTKLSNSTYFDPESLVSFTLQSNAKKSINSKSTPCLIQQQTSQFNTDQIDSPTKTPKNKRKSTINWPFRRNSNEKQQQPNSPAVPYTIQQHTSKTVSMFHKKLLSKSQSNLKSNNKSPKSTTLSIMSNVTLKRSSKNNKQTIKLFGQSINKLCLGDRHLIAPVKNMLIELMKRAPQTVGIFRKSANARVCRELKAELEQNPDCDLTEYPIIVIASVFKELLRSLPDSVLVGKMYQKWLEAAKLIDNSSISNSECTAFIRPLIKCLPKANCLLLQHFLCILHYIAIQSAENKMSAENLAVCIGPSLLNHDVAPASMHCELSKQVPKLISYLIKNCSELFGSSTLNLFESYQNIINENKENQNFEDAKLLKEKNENKDSGAEESDNISSSSDQTKMNANNAINKDNNLYINDNHLHFQPQSPTSPSLTNTFSSSTSFNSSSTNKKEDLSDTTTKIYQQLNNSNNDSNNNTTINNNNNTNSNNEAGNIKNCSSNSTSSASSISSTNAQRLQTTNNNSVHQSFYVPMLSHQHHPYAVNKVSLSNLSRDSGLTLSDTQLYSPEEEDDDEDDYHHIINQHLHLNKKLNSIVSDKRLSTKNQFKINSSANKITNNSTSLKKKCSKINRLNATSSEDDLHDDLEDIVDIDELSEKSCESENCAPSLYSRVYNKHNTVSQHHLLTKSAPQLASIETTSHVTDKQTSQISQIMKDKPRSQKDKITCTTIPLYLHSINKNNSLSTNSATNSSCNSPSSSSTLSSTSLNLSSSNEYSASELQRKYFTSTPQQLTSTPITTSLQVKQTHIVTISAKGNSLQFNKNLENNPTSACSVSINKDPLSISNTTVINQKSVVNNVNQTKFTNQPAPPSYQETMNRKEINARMANLVTATNSSRKICNSEIDNLISKKIYEKSLRVYNADVHKNLTLRAVPVQVKSQSSDSESDCDQYAKLKNNNTKMSNKSSCDQVDSYLNRTLIRSKPIIEQTCAKDQTEYWKKDINWSVATLRNKFTELCNKQNQYSTINYKNLKQLKSNSCKSIGSIYDLCRPDQVKEEKTDEMKSKLKSNSLSHSSQLDNKNCVTIIHVKHQQTRSNDSLSGEESYV